MKNKKKGILSCFNGGSAPHSPRDLTLFGPMHKGKMGAHDKRPLCNGHLFGAQVASQRCLILRTDIE
jgi:hypothetical protein